MGSMWVDDPSWGSIANNIFGQLNAAPNNASEMALRIEQIKDARQKRAEAEKLGASIDAAIASNKAYWDTQQPPPSTYTTPGPMVGDVNNPADTAGIPTAKVQWQDPNVTADFNRKRQLEEAQYAVAVRNAKSMEDVAKGAPHIFANTQLNLSGIPDDQASKDVMQTQLTGSIPSYDETKQPLKNWVVMGPNNTILDHGTTHDFITDTSGRPVPQGAVIGGQATMQPQPTAGALGDKGLALQEFSNLAWKANDPNQQLSTTDIERGNVLREMLYPQQGQFSQQGGRNQWVVTRQGEIPAYATRLSDLIDHYKSGAWQQPGAVMPPHPVYEPGGGDPTQAANSPAAIASSSQQPIVPPNAVAASQQAANQPPQIAANQPIFGVKGPGNPAEIRKEVMNTQQFSDYNNAITSWNTMAKAAMSENPTNATDLNIIYAIAKIFDPNSVVREGELSLASSTGTIGQQLMANYSRLFRDRGTLDPTTRANLIEQGQVRMNEIANNAKTLRDWYTNAVLPEQGLNPASTLPPLTPMNIFNREEAIKRGEAAQATTPAAQAAPGSDPVVDRARQIVGGQ